MDFAIKVCSPATDKTNAIVIGVMGQVLSPSAQAIDTASDGALSRAIKAAGFEGKPAQTLPLYGLSGVAADLVLVVGAGNEAELECRNFFKAVTSATKGLSGVKKAISFLAELPVKDRDLNTRIADIARISLEATYRFDAYKSKKADNKGLTGLTIAVADKADVAAGKTAAAWGQAVALGQNTARDLGNQPPNICNPKYLSAHAKDLAAANSKKLSVTVIGEKEAAALGMGAFLAVSKGSDQEGQLIVLDYKGGKKSQAPIALVGKGITFDTGGISLKPGAGMDEMKYDMCGAASVLGVMNALVESQLPINVIGVVVAAENMPSGGATRPGDIVTTMSGQTVEILNTDAEGRLVLCDALTYVGKYKPSVVIDIATLTGACVVALGKVVSGLFTPSDELADDLLTAGIESGDRAWRMPLLSEYQDMIESPFADIANIGNAPNAGAITAACFLARFTKDYNWAHLDVAGTAWHSGAAKGATGRPVPQLLQFLKNRAEQSA